jgi:hypothetical protein
VPALLRFDFLLARCQVAIIPENPKKKMGRPRPGIGKTIGLRLYPEEEAALDAWIAAQPAP